MLTSVYRTLSEPGPLLGPSHISPLHPSGQNSGVSVTGTVETFVSPQPGTRVEPSSGCAVQTSEGARGGLEQPLDAAGESGVAGRGGRGTPQLYSEPTRAGYQGQADTSLSGGRGGLGA